MKNNFVVVGMVGSGQVYEDEERKDLFFFHMYVYVNEKNKRYVRVYIKNKRKISDTKERIVRCTGHIEAQYANESVKMYLIADTMELVSASETFENLVTLEGIVFRRPFYKVENGKGNCMTLLKTGQDILACTLNGKVYDEIVRAYQSDEEISLGVHVDVRKEKGKTCLELTQ